MAEIVISGTPAVNVANVNIQSIQLGETITKGMALFRDNSNNKFMMASCDVDEATARVRCICITGGILDDFVFAVFGGEYTVGGTVVSGDAYVLGTTPGKIMPAFDLAINNWITHLGYGKTSAACLLGINPTGIQQV